MSRSSEMVEKAAVEEEMGGSRQAEGCSHIHHHLFVYIETADHLQTDSISVNAAGKTTEFPNQRIKISLSGWNVLIRDKCLNGPLYRSSLPERAAVLWHYDHCGAGLLPETPWWVPPPLFCVPPSIKLRPWMITTVQARCERWVHKNECETNWADLLWSHLLL